MNKNPLGEALKAVTIVAMLLLSAYISTLWEKNWPLALSCIVAVVAAAAAVIFAITLIGAKKRLKESPAIVAEGQFTCIFVQNPPARKLERRGFDCTTELELYYGADAATVASARSRRPSSEHNSSLRGAPSRRATLTLEQFSRLKGEAIVMSEDTATALRNANVSHHFFEDNDIVFIKNSSTTER